MTKDAVTDPADEPCFEQRLGLMMRNVMRSFEHGHPPSKRSSVQRCGYR